MESSDAPPSLSSLIRLGLIISSTHTFIPEQGVIPQFMKFRDIEFRPEILQALEDMGFEDLSPIQEKTLLPIIDRRDIVGIAETGSGKTSACGIPLSHFVDEDLMEVQVLVLVPTRELAFQYVDEIAEITKYTKIVPAAVFGGVPINIQQKQLKHGVQVLVATPGRLIDLLHTGKVDFKHLQTLVLDEADAMLDMGFLEDVEFIMSCIVVEHQTLLFSATMPRVLDKLIQRHLHDPVRIELNLSEVSPESLSHQFQHVGRGSDRVEILQEFLQDPSRYRQVLIFCNSRFKGDRLYREIRKAVPKSDYLHGGLSQEVRSRIFGKFKSGDLPILIATDVAGRGLDFSNVSHVINYDLPQDPVAYTHRTGRAGRMGKKGTALSFVTDHDIRACFRIIEKNRIDPVWHGEIPSEQQQSKSRGRRRTTGRR